YQVGATQCLGFDAGLLTFYLATAPGQIDLARAELLAEIEKIAVAGIPAAAFARVRASVLSALALQQQSPSAIAQHVALDILFGLPADSHRHLPEIYKALTPAIVRDVAARVLAQPATVVTILPEAVDVREATA
ncbi:MAG: hypothetical protein WCP45_15865, partial [Verrucomicrobiota bacterium]